MKSNELRINNYVTDGGEIVQMVYITKDNTDHLEPIPLTEEWLTKLGVPDCLLDPNNYYEPFDGVYWLKGKLICSIESKYQIEVPQYVHQLQNLYFALTGEDLTNKT